MINPELSAGLESSHGEHVEFDGRKHGVFAFTKPSRAVWARFQNDVNKPKPDLQVAFDTLVVSCLVYPEAPEGQAKLLAMFEDYPASSTEIGGELSKLATGGEAVRVGKR